MRLTGSAGPLRLGITRAAARRFLHFPRYKASRNGVRCAQYVMGSGARRGLTGACFGARGHLIGFSVSGQAFCFRPGACVNGRDPVPRSIRARFRRKLDPSNGVYYAYDRVRLGGHSYQIVMEGPGTDPTWSIRAIGFGPCGASAMVRYYVPVKC